MRAVEQGWRPPCSTSETLLQPGNKTSLLSKMNVKTIKRSRLRRRVSRERERFWRDHEDDEILEQ